MQEILDHDEFCVEAWDYISPNVVNNIFWEENQDFIRACTFDQYRIYTQLLNERGFPILSTKLCGRMLENIFFHAIASFK